MDNYIYLILIPGIGWGVRKHLVSKKDYTPLKKTTLIIALVCYFLTETGRSFYRPFIYSHNIQDFFIADTLGNTVGTMTAIFMVLTMSGKGTHSDWKIIVIIIAGLLGYEFLNLAGNPCFDIHDIYATLIFGALSFFIYARLLQKHRQSHVQTGALQTDG